MSIIPAYNSYLLPYQIGWLKDKARLKIWEKSRRIGATYVQSLEDVLDCAHSEKGVDVWFSSADITAAREYIRYCAIWADMLQAVGGQYGYNIVEKMDKHSIIFSNNKRINALSSNPKNFRSKGGKIILDEFAFHECQDELWRAASPCATWGFPIRILSTYNGKKNLYYHMVQKAKKGNEWSCHTTTIFTALEQGLLHKITKAPTTQKQQDAFIAMCQEQSGHDSIFEQEFNCNPIDETTAWITWDMIQHAIIYPQKAINIAIQGDIYIGMDIGRRHDLSVICVMEKHQGHFIMRHLARLKNETFAAQKQTLDAIIAQYKPIHIAIDQTGIGEKFLEDIIASYNNTMIEGVYFTNKVKKNLAFITRYYFENRHVHIFNDTDLKNAIHAIERTVTNNAYIRFDASRNNKGHADEFWALALSLYAGHSDDTKALSRIDEQHALNDLLDTDLSSFSL